MAIEQKDMIGEGAGPFPRPQSHECPWEATEARHGPFERRRGPDRRTPDELGAETGEAAESGRRRRWGRRKSDVLTTEARGRLSGRNRALFRRLREPIIGLTLAGVAVPLINAGTGAPGEAAREPTPSGEADRATGVGVAERDLEAEVSERWAEAEDESVRGATIEGAMASFGIDETLAAQIYDAAVRHDIEPDIAYGLVRTESTFRNDAVSHVGARGLAQLMPRTAKWLDPSISVRDLYKPEKNLDLGFRYLRQLIDKYGGNVENALTAYNRGPGTVDRILKRGGNPDNGYAGKVLAG